MFHRKRATQDTSEALRSDEALIQACRQGDAQAWQALLDQYERLVFFIPLKYGLSHDDAADVAQYCFIALMESLDNLRDDSNLAAWLSTVAERRTWRLLKQYRRERIGDEEDVAQDASLIGTTDGRRPLERGEQLEWINEGLSHIGDRCRELLLALYFDRDEPSYAEVAQKLGMPVGSIGPTRARCLERLRQVMGKDRDER